MEEIQKKAIIKKYFSIRCRNISDNILNEALITKSKLKNYSSYKLRYFIQNLKSKLKVLSATDQNPSYIKSLCNNHPSISQELIMKFELDNQVTKF